MKCTIPEISWHNRDPVLSVDIQANSANDGFYRLASGGTDCHVLIWMMRIKENGAVEMEILADLTRHQRAVNVVRWSPNGQYLATGDDDANIIIWQLKTDNIPLLDGESSDKETWTIFKTLRGHKEDVYDLCWSPDGSRLLSGSIDNTAILWNVAKGRVDCILSDHKGFVQGVTWDPQGQFIATLSSDRICRIFHHSGKPVITRIYKGKLPVGEHDPLHAKEMKYFHDDTFKSYFRRLTFSPDGNLLLAPSGHVERDEDKVSLHVTYIFSLDSPEPIAMLPSQKQCTIAVRCCPLRFELWPDGPQPVIDLPYRMIFAVATESDVFLYDTQQLTPFAHLQKIHYTRLTDLAWSLDGRILICSSTDGFCTLVTFERGELGVEYVKEVSEEEEMEADVSLMDVSVVEDVVEEEKVKRPNLLEQWTIKTPKRDQSMEKKTQNVVANPSEGTRKRITPLQISNPSVEVITIEDDEKDATNPKKLCKQSPKTRMKVKQPVNKNSILNFLTPRKTTSESKVQKADRDDANEKEKRLECPDKIVEISSAKENGEKKLEEIVESATIEDRQPLTVTPKAPRRIALITLSSPKEMKKRGT